MKRSRTVGIVATVAVLATGCSSGSAGGGGGALHGTVTVFAASSLTGAFQKIAADFQSYNPGVTIRFNLGPSDSLATQIQQQAGADVFASADPTYMQEVSSSPGVTGQVDFARNDLVLITPAANPADIQTLSDITRKGVKLILAAPGVPVGDYARQMLTDAGILKPALSNVVSNEQDDAALVQKIVSNEADAAVVYSSDLTKQVTPLVHAIQIPAGDNVMATYQMAVVKGSANPSLAQDFVSYVTGASGQKTLRFFGFLPPG